MDDYSNENNTRHSDESQIFKNNTKNLSLKISDKFKFLQDNKSQSNAVGKHTPLSGENTQKKNEQSPQTLINKG